MADPRELVFDDAPPEEQPRRESLLGLGNGVLFRRACPPEAAAGPRGDGVPAEGHYPGLYRAGFYDHAQREVAGETTAITSLARLPDPLALGLRLGEDPGWFAPGEVELLHLRQRLDMEAGLGQRELVFRDRAGRETRLREESLVSLAQDGLLLLRWELTPLNWSGPLRLRALLPLRVVNAKLERTRAYEGRHVDVAPLPAPGRLAVRVRTTDGRRALRIESRLLAQDGGEPPGEGRGEHALWQELRREARRGEALRVELRATVEPLEGAGPGEAAGAGSGDEREAGDAAVAAHRAAWRGLWDEVRIEMPGEPGLERRCRFSAFHLLQTASPRSAAHDCGLPARGWQEGYFGHVFWDELFAFPFYSLRFPQIARGLLLYRHRRLDAAREAARRAGLRGAMYPWRSAASGAEETPAWQFIPPAGRWRRDHTRLQRHIGAAIAHNLWQHHLATGDLELFTHCTGEMLVEIARFWASLATPAADGSGRLSIRGVIGPDEYHDGCPDTEAPGLDDNAYTNVMAAWTLCCASRLPERLPHEAWRALRARTGLQERELADWDAVGRRLVVPMLEGGVIAQFDGFERLRPPDAPPLPQRDPGQRTDWWLQARGEDVDAYQVTKQADVLMLFHLLGHGGAQALLAHLGAALPPGGFERTVRYYMARITHESSLSHIACAGALAGLDPEASWHYFRKSLHSDLGPDASAGTHEGLHLGAMAGAWDVLQRLYLGLHLEHDALVVAPDPPPALREAGTQLRVRGSRLRADLRGGRLRLALLEGPDLVLRHGGDCRRLRAGDALELPCGAPGREPGRA